MADVGSIVAIIIYILIDIKSVVRYYNRVIKEFEMANCFILIGAPGVGKSTWVKKNEVQIWTHSTDNIIQTICDLCGTTYDASFKELIQFAERIFWRDIDADAKNNIDIYIDRTNMSVKSRKRIIDRLKNKGYKFYAVVFNTPEENEWKRRLNSRDGKSIPQDVINSMLKNFEYPTYEEGFSEIEEVTT